MQKINILNKYKDEIPDNAVNVMRPNVLGNPYSVEEYGRERCLELFKIYLQKEYTRGLASRVFRTIGDLVFRYERGEELNLVCCCPKPKNDEITCHAQIIKNDIIDIFNELK